MTRKGGENESEAGKKNVVRETTDVEVLTTFFFPSILKVCSKKIFLKIQKLSTGSTVQSLK